jgi:riboflavin synthase
MFTGIIETLGTITAIEKVNENLHFSIRSSFSNELKIDQSVAHNGICLTVVDIVNDIYSVTAIKETILKTNIGFWQLGDKLNLERGMQLGARLDGHIVQGHVDQTAICTTILNADGSWYFTFEYNPLIGNITIEKGSITVNGVSLTVVDSKPNAFSVAIIPYTYQHTNFSTFKVGTQVNLEFDVIGKYVTRLHQLRTN